MGGFARYRTTIEIEFDQLEIILPPLYCEIHERRAIACAADISDFCLRFPCYLEKGVREKSAFSTFFHLLCHPPALERVAGLGYWKGQISREEPSSGKSDL